MTKLTPGWSNGLTPAKTVAPAPAKGHQPPATPHFQPVSPPGKPASGVDQPFKRSGNEPARGNERVQRG